MVLHYDDPQACSKLVSAFMYVVKGAAMTAAASTDVVDAV